MQGTSKPIHLSCHAKEQLAFRGTNEEEITSAIKTSEWKKAGLDRLECSKDFAYNKDWNNKRYKTKQIRPIFVEEKDKIVVITAYAYYF